MRVEKKAAQNNRFQINLSYQLRLMFILSFLLINWFVLMILTSIQKSCMYFILPDNACLSPRRSYFFPYAKVIAVAGRESHVEIGEIKT